MTHFTNILVIAIKIYLPNITELGKECLKTVMVRNSINIKKKLTSTSRLKSLNAKKCHDIH